MSTIMVHVLLIRVVSKGITTICLFYFISVGTKCETNEFMLQHVEDVHSSSDATRYISNNVKKNCDNTASDSEDDVGWVVVFQLQNG